MLDVKIRQCGVGMQKECRCGKVKDAVQYSSSLHLPHYKITQHVRLYVRFFHLFEVNKTNHRLLFSSGRPMETNGFLLLSKVDDVTAELNRLDCALIQLCDSMAGEKTDKLRICPRRHHHHHHGYQTSPSHCPNETRPSGATGVHPAAIWE